MGIFKKKEIALQPADSVDVAVKQIIKYNSLVSDMMGIGSSQFDPIENITSIEQNFFGSSARNLYRSLDLIQRIIDDPAEQSLRHGFKLNTNFDEIGLNKLLQTRLDELQFNEKALDFLIYSRLYSRGALLIPVMKERIMEPSRGHISKPLILTDIENIIGLNVIQEDFFDYHVQHFDPLAINFNGIERLHVQGTPVHPTRVFLTVLSLDPHRQRGISILDRIVMAAKGINIAEWTITNMLLRYRALLVKYPAKEMLSFVKDKKSAIRNIINDIKMKFTSKSVAAVPDNYQFEYLQTSFAGLKEATTFLYEYLSSVSHIPQSIIKGSAMGQLASAEKDERTYQDYIKASEQEKKLKPLLQFLIPIMLNERDGEIYRTLQKNGIASNQVDVDIEFESMLSINPLQDSQRKLIDSQRGIIDIGNEIRNPDEVRSELYPTLDPMFESGASRLEQDQQLKNPFEFFNMMGLNGG